MSWEEAAADALDAKADTIEHAVLSVTRIAGIFADSSKRRHEILSFVTTLEADAENLRSEGKRLREAGQSLEANGRR